MSGFWRPSRVGPGLEKVARFPTAGVPPKDDEVPLQHAQLCVEVQAAVVITPSVFPGSLISSSVA